MFLNRTYSHPKKPGCVLGKYGDMVLICLSCTCAYLFSHCLVITDKHQMANVLFTDKGGGSFKKRLFSVTRPTLRRNGKCLLFSSNRKQI